MCINSPAVFFRFFGGVTKKNERKQHHFSKKERADDNFTKKPQKKLIRYMVNFCGYNTNH